MEVVEQTKQLYLDESMVASPLERCEYSNKIYDIILPLILDVEEDLHDEELKQLLCGYKTHEQNLSSFGYKERQGKTQKVWIRLFTNWDKRTREEVVQDLANLQILLCEFMKHREGALFLFLYQRYTSVYTGKDLDCSALHKKIKVP